MKLILNVLAVALFSVTATFAQAAINSENGIAIDGYDVVSYFDGTAKKGNNALSSMYKGTTFYFSAKNNLEKFKSTPEKFIPSYGGYCAYAVAVKGKKVSVNPETFEIRDGKLLLFYNKRSTNTLELWQNENPEELVKKADTNWKKIVSKYFNLYWLVKFN